MPATLSFFAAGSATPGAPLLVGVHGFMGSGRDWEKFAAAFSTLAPNWRLVFPDLPGHGGSAPLVNPSIEELGDALRDWLREENLLPAVLAGYSLGFRVVLPLVLQHPELCRALLSVSGTAGLRSAEERQERAARDAQLAERLRHCERPEDLREFLRDWWQQPVFARRGEALFQQLAPLRQNHDPAIWAQILLAASPAHAPSHWQELRNFPHSVGLAYGAEDTKYQTLAKEMAAEFPQAQLFPLEKAAHDLLHDAPERLAQATYAWLQRTGLA